MRAKTFSTHVTTKIAPAVRETGLFTHGRASPNFTIIPLMSQCHVHAVPGSDVPCPCAIAPSAPPARELLSCPVSQPHSPTLRNRTSGPDSLSILSLLAFHPSSQALAVTLSFPHRSSPPHSKLPSIACVLKRFPRTSPRKLPLTCVKWGFLRTAEPHCASQLSPCAPLMSQCHVHEVPGSDVP